MNSLFDECVGLKELSKTLKFSLIPTENTKENLIEIQESDQKRAKSYPIVKKLIDDAYRKCIDNTYKDSNFDFDELYRLFLRLDDLDNKNKYEKLQNKLIKELEKKIKKNDEFKSLQNGKFLDTLLNKDDLTETEKEALENFKKFTVYFIGFQQNRENVFSSDDISTSLYVRMIENLDIYFKNSLMIKEINQNSPNIIENIENNMKKFNFIKESESLIKDYLQPNSYNRYLIQNGIDLYNKILGGFVVDEEKYQGLNELVNLYNQQNPESKLKKCIPLYKQILSEIDKKPLFDIINSYDELLDKLKNLVNILENQDFNNLVKDLISNIKNYNLSEIYISTDGLNILSARKFHNYSEIINVLKDSLVNEIKRTKKNGKLSKKEEELIRKKLAIREEGKKEPKQQNFSVKEINSRYEDITKYKLDIETIYKEYVLDILEEEKLKFDKLKQLVDKVDFNNIKDEKNINIAKEYLDVSTKLNHALKNLLPKAQIKIDGNFYSEYEEIMSLLYESNKVLNIIRNYVTKTNYDKEKILLKFDIPTLGYGWSKSKEKDNKTILLRKNGYYYLAIINHKSKFKFDNIKSGKDNYEKMEYFLFNNINMQIPHCIFKENVKEHFKNSNEDYKLFTDKFLKEFIITKELYETYNHYYDGVKKFQKEYLKKNPHDIKGHRRALEVAIEGCKEFLSCYKLTNIFDFKDIKNTKDYKNIQEFYKDISRCTYKVNFREIDKEKIDEKVKSKDILLFKIYNKDFSKNKRGKDNLHTMYLKALFSDENLSKNYFRLSGNAEIFYRKPQIINPVIHKKGDKVINKTYEENGIIKSIPSQYILEINECLKENSLDNLSDDAKYYYEKSTVREFEYDVVKNRRFTKEHYEFHFPIKINAECNEYSLNNIITEGIKNSKDVNIIGIDRGERNLLYIAVINQDGEILEQKSLNVINGVDYQQKLDQREKERDLARKSWKTIENIKDLKKGYLSAAIHEISKLIIKYNAIIILENLNVGFKRGRFKFEKQIYQNFENMLSNKLSYLVFKDRNINENGSVLKGYQLAQDNSIVTGNQNGIIFYVPAGYTSKIDPVSGFVNIFNLKNITDIDSKKTFLSNMDLITYDDKTDTFKFKFNFNNYKTNQTPYIKEWEIYTYGERIVNMKNSLGKWEANKIDLSKELKAILEYKEIDYKIKSDLKNIILNDKQLINEFFDIFKLTIKLRNSSNIMNEDYIISPVLVDGQFYDSRKSVKTLPIDADANGAYNIARKGLMGLKTLQNSENAIFNSYISNLDWLEYVQKNYRG